MLTCPGLQSYVCCDLTNSIYDVWLPWVIAGSLALVLCLLASIRVITATVKPVGRSGTAPAEVGSVHCVPVFNWRMV